MIDKIDHIGIAVHSIEQAEKFYRDVLGLQPEKGEEIVSQGVRTAFFTVGEVRIELLEPINDRSPVARFLAKRGEGIHHIAYATDDIEAQLKIAGEHGCRLIHTQPVTGGGGKSVAFVHPAACFGVLTEFCQKPNG